MPKPNLSRMDINSLMDLRDQVDQRLREHRVELQKQLERIALLGGKRVARRGGGRSASALRGRKVPPKYRSPSGDTWAGRGAKPRWLVAAIKEGKKLDDFLIEKSGRKGGKGAGGNGDLRPVGRSLNSRTRKKPKHPSEFGIMSLGASMTTDPDRHASLFIGNACQYYATARFAMHAQCMPVCGNLFHHAVEMLVKGGLARTRKSSNLKNMGHKLKLLWRAFKADFPDTSLKRHDRTISLLDKFEAIRYPDTTMKHGMGMTAQWSGPAGKVTVHGGLKTPRQYTVVVSDIDDLIADVFKASSWNPAAFIGTNPAALEAISRCNNHSKFLTKRS